MFQNIVNATEPMEDEKEAIAYVSNNATRKEIIMCVEIHPYNNTSHNISHTTGSEIKPKIAMSLITFDEYISR
jgi:hypothetical protein